MTHKDNQPGALEQIKNSAVKGICNLIEKSPGEFLFGCSIMLIMSITVLGVFIKEIIKTIGG